MTQPNAGRDLLDELVEYLRGFALLGRGVPVPVRVPVGRGEGHSFEEREVLYKVRSLWCGRGEIDPDELLKGMLGYVRPRPGCDGKQSLWGDSAPDCREIELFLESAKRAPSSEKCASDYERWSAMDGAKEVVIQFEGMFPRDVPVVNPLVGLARRERERGCPCVDPRDRAHTLDEFERLSRDLWHLCTAVDPEVLRARLLLLPDFGAAELELLRVHGDLIGLAGVDAGGEGEGPTFDRAGDLKGLAS